MAREPRIVAELGRPETPDETAERKAESSRVYRSSQNVRNLVAALLATLAVVAVIIFGVPRGSAPEREPVDVAAVAERIAASEGRTVIAPEMSEGWVVNRAGIEGDGSARAFTVVYAPAGQDDRVQPPVQRDDLDQGPLAEQGAQLGNAGPWGGPVGAAGHVAGTPLHGLLQRGLAPA